MSQELSCPRCRQVLGADDANLETAIGRCLHCNRVFSLYDQIQGLFEQGEEPLRTRAPVSLPPRFHLDESGDALTIRWRWFKASVFFLLFFAIAWDGFLFAWYTGATLHDGTPFMVFAFPLIHVGVGVWLTYQVLTGFVNSTRVTADRERLVVRHGPLPWLGNKNIESSKLEQIYVAQTEKSTKNGSSYFRYEVRAQLKGQAKEVKLLKGLEESEQALFVEQELERFLRIRDRAVPGEMGR
jgi:hypothetical protein